MSTTSSPPTERRADLDALRAAAMLLGIVLHASLSFFPSMWMVTDQRQEPGLGLLLAALHGFRMPVFFVMSGFFSAMLLHRWGRAKFIKHRFRRIFLPLLLGTVTIVPLTLYVSVKVGAAPKTPEPATATAEKEKTSTLWTAADAGDLDAIERELANGAEINGLDEWHLTPLNHAAISNRAEATELLLKRGADMNIAATDGATPLHVAAFFGNQEVATVLIAHGADVNAKDNYRKTPLDNALIDEGRTIDYAATAKIPVNKDGLGGRKAAIAETLRQHGAKAESQVIAALMQFPLFSHLWFLWFLWWLVLGLAAVSAIGSRLPSFGLPAWLVVSPARYLWLIPLTMIPQWFMAEGVFGPDTSSGLIPIPHVLAYYAVFFGFGVLDYKYDAHSGRVGKHGWLPLSLALLVVFPLGTSLLYDWPLALGTAFAPQTGRLLSVALQAAYPWLMTFGLMGLFRHLCSTENPTVRYVSDSAYWLYLAHLPLVIWMQYLVRDWPLPALVKLTLIVVVATAFLLWTYQTMVRYTWLGRFLNGPRARPNRVGEVASATA